MAPNVEEVRRFSARHLAFISPLVLIHLACGLVFVVGASRRGDHRISRSPARLSCSASTMGYHRLLWHRSFDDEPLVPVLCSPSWEPSPARTGRCGGSPITIHHHLAMRIRTTTSTRRVAGIFWSQAWGGSSPRIIPIRARAGDRARPVAGDAAVSSSTPSSCRSRTRSCCTLLGAAWGRLPTSAAGVSGTTSWLRGAVLSTACVLHVALSVGSVAHLYGTRPSRHGTIAGNNVVLVLLAARDGWQQTIITTVRPRRGWGSAGGRSIPTTRCSGYLPASESSGI